MRIGRHYCVFLSVLATTLTPALAADLFKGDECIPADAIVLFDGKDLSEWVSCGSDSPAPWKVENGYVQAGGGDICTKKLFKDCQLHVEFWLPLMADRPGQARANSGVFLQGWNYEVQILDSYGLKSGAGDCGAIYGITAPMTNACRPPEHWQTFDIFFHAPRFDENGTKIANARISVMQNGVWIHENVEVPHPTPSASMA
ncbi:MAG: 3-keto-disaccharide hydrolase, partial [Armatimonadota bacterium]